MQPDSSPPPNLDLERDWFWTGVPAGFIAAVIGLLGYAVGGFWVGLIVIVVLVVAGAVWSSRDGAQCRTMFTLGSLLLLLPTAIVGFLVLHAYLPA